MQYKFLRWWYIGAFLLFCSIAYPFVSSLAGDDRNNLAIQEEVKEVTSPWFQSSPSLFIEPIAGSGDRSFHGIIDLSLAQGWHTYWKNPGSVGSSPSISWELPSGLEVASVEWPIPSEFSTEEGDLKINSFGYSGNIQVFVTFKASASYQPKSDTSVIRAHLDWVMCSDTQCVPEVTDLEAQVISLEGAEGSQMKARFDEMAKKALLQIPEEKSSIRLQLVKDRAALELLLPSSLQKDTPLSQENVRGVFLFFEEPGIQNTAKGSLLIDLNGYPYAIQVVISEKKVNELLGEKNEPYLFSGVYRYTVADAQDPQKIQDFFGKFTNVSLISIPSPQEETKEQPFNEIISRFQGSPSGDSQDELNTLLIFLGLAFMGGIILNVMPCVLPVIGLKVLHLLSYREEGENSERKKVKGIARFGLSFALGVISAFWILALIVYMLQYMGSTVGWGFQLQEPWFVLTLILVLFVLSLSMFGLFEFGLSISSKAASIQTNASTQVVYDSKVGEVSPKKIEGVTSDKSQHVQSFLSGLLVTVIATPCTGPLLGSVAGFLATLHPIQGFAIFTALGLGVSFPYLIFTAFPSLLRLLPRPGKWMVTFKQFLGFLLLATVAWLLWVLEAQVGPLPTTTFAALFLILSLSAWIYGSWATPVHGIFVRGVASILAMSLTIASLVLAPSIINRQDSAHMDSKEPSSQALEWKPFSMKALNDTLQEGKPVLVEVTAKWCLTCQVNKAVFLSSRVIKAIKENDIVLYRADWTKKDDEITQFLRSFGRNGVPTYIYFPKGLIGEDARQDEDQKKPYLLPELLTVDSLLYGLGVEDDLPSSAE